MVVFEGDDIVYKGVFPTFSRYVAEFFIDLSSSDSDPLFSRNKVEPFLRRERSPGLEQ